MLILVLGLIVFFGVHSIAIAAPHWRERVVLRLGVNAWRGIYSIVSLLGFALLLVGYAHARRMPIVLYTPPAALHYLTFVLMLPVFPLLFATYLPGRIQAAMKHPMLAAIKIWATAHLLANGTLADVLLFGAFLLWAVVDRISLKRRPQHPLSQLPRTHLNDAIAVVGGLGLYALFVASLHALLIGVPLLAR
jgi:uncharacterized membrane protein